jgi:hypothetical protein
MASKKKTPPKKVAPPKPLSKRPPLKPSKKPGKPKTKLPTLGGGLMGMGGSGAQGGMS